MPETTQRTIIFIGSQGSGKGTQARLLKEYFEIKSPAVPAFLFGTGAGFREFAGKDGVTNKLVSERLAPGEILPVFLPIWLWTKMCIENLKGNEHIIFDGSPRTELEAEVLESAFVFYGRRAVDVVVLNIPKATALERVLSRGRADDTESAISARLNWFEENIRPVLGFFEENPRYNLISIDGTQTPDAVQAAIKTSLDLQ